MTKNIFEADLNVQAINFKNNSVQLLISFGDLSELAYIVKIPLDSVDIWYIWEINTGQHMLIKHCRLVLIWVELVLNSIAMKRKHVIKENLLMIN